MGVKPDVQPKREAARTAPWALLAKPISFDAPISMHEITFNPAMKKTLAVALWRLPLSFAVVRRLYALQVEVERR